MAFRQTAFRSLRWFLLAAIVMVQVGCAADERARTAGYDSNDLEPAPSHDDGHGWGTNISQTGSR